MIGAAFKWGAILIVVWGLGFLLNPWLTQVVRNPIIAPGVTLTLGFLLGAITGKLGIV